MDFLQLTLKDFQYLCALAETKHFGRAAEFCHVAQPSLSIQIKKIESVLNVTLFERTNRSVTLTDIGEIVVKHAKFILEQSQLFSEMIQKDRKPLSGRCRLGLIHTIGPYLVPLFLKNLKKQFPLMRLQLTEGMTADLLQQLDDHLLDVIIASDSQDFSKYAKFPLFFEPFVLMVANEHPLSKKKEILLSDINMDDMLFLEKGNCLTDDVQKVCQFQDHIKKSNISATSIETLRYLVSCSNGYALIPKSSVVHSKNIDQLVTYKSFSDSKFGRNVVLIARKTYPFPKDLKALKDFFKDISF